MTTALTNTNGAGALAGFDPEAIKTIKNTVAKGATDAELAMFLHLAARYGLDPFAKEIWCTKYVKQGQNPEDVPATIIVSRDGYLKAAQQDPDFDGIASGVVKEGDLFAFNPVNGTVSHEFGAKRGAILGAWAVVHHKRRRPVACFADFAEYKGNSPIWQNYPSAMIQKVAEVHALKRQFGLSGLVSKEELDYQDDDAPTPVMIAQPAQSARLLTEPQTDDGTHGTPSWEKANKRLRAIVGKAGKALDLPGSTVSELVKELIKSEFGFESSKDCTADDLRHLADLIEADPKILIGTTIDAEPVGDDDIPDFDPDAPFVGQETTAQ